MDNYKKHIKYKNKLINLLKNNSDSNSPQFKYILSKYEKYNNQQNAGWWWSKKKPPPTIIQTQPSKKSTGKSQIVHSSTKYKGVTATHGTTFKFEDTYYKELPLPKTVFDDCRDTYRSISSIIHDIKNSINHCPDNKGYMGEQTYHDNKDQCVNICRRVRGSKWGHGDLDLKNLLDESKSCHKKILFKTSYIGRSGDRRRSFGTTCINSPKQALIKLYIIFAIYRALIIFLATPIIRVGQVNYTTYMDKLHEYIKKLPYIFLKMW